MKENTWVRAYVNNDEEDDDDDDDGSVDVDVVADDDVDETKEEEEDDNKDDAFSMVSMTTFPSSATCLINNALTAEERW